ncbi:MAG: hypothetical protein WCI30_01605 [Clostridia bacterium]
MKLKHLILSLLSITLIIFTITFEFHTPTIKDAPISSNINSTISTSEQAIIDSEAALKQQIAALASVLQKAEQLRLGYYYPEAISLLENNLALSPTAIQLEIATVRTAQNALVKYTGPIQHIFFHSLIVYPELAFDGSQKATGYNMWMTTVTEFQRMLPALKERGYVLYDLAALVKTSGSSLVLQDIFLPPDKMPLIISQDDVNYYDYMAENGFASRLVLNSQGQVATLVQKPDKSYETTLTGDIVPILDSYVAENPAFSFRGAKGTLALTGYAGAFGYTITDLQGANLANDRLTVQKISAQLRATGWNIANHSYTHNQSHRTGKLTLQSMEYDLERWQELIMPYIGKTNIYISPFGVSYQKNDPRFRTIIQYGYQIFCSVERTPRLHLQGDNLIMTRFNLDGYTFSHSPSYIKEHFFDVEQIRDVKRPPLN